MDEEVAYWNCHRALYCMQQRDLQEKIVINLRMDIAQLKEHLTQMDLTRETKRLMYTRLIQMGAAVAQEERKMNSCVYDILIGVALLNNECCSETCKELYCEKKKRNTKALI